MDITSLFRHSRPELAAQTIHWEYKPLHDIEILGDGNERFARLICEDDEGGDMFVITCNSRHFRHLEPYAAALQDWKADHFAHETPVIPITYGASGQARFSLDGAEHDHPDLTKRQVNIKLPADLAHQIRKAAKAQGMTRAELVMSALLKSATKSG